jgi:HEAT repeat protein
LDLFSLIWNVSFALAALSILTLFILFVRRLIIQFVEARRARRRAVLQDMIFTYLSDPVHAQFPAKLSARDQGHVMSLAIEMMRRVTGPMREQLVALLENTIDEDRIIKALRRARAGQRAKYAARLWWARSPNVHAALRDALDDRAPAVVLAAANSLIMAGQTLNLLDLVPKLESRDMLGHRAVRDIFRKLAPDNVSALFALMEDRNPSIVVLAIDALARMSSPTVLRRLAHIAHSHQSVDVRATALRTIGLIGDPDLAPVVLQGLSDPAWEVKVQAAIAAGRLRLAAALEPLTCLLTDSNWWVQLRAAQALTKLGAPGIAALENARGNASLASVADFALAERHA